LVDATGEHDEVDRAARRRERFLTKLAELAREYEAPLRGMELVKSRLRFEDWGSLSLQLPDLLRHQSLQFFDQPLPDASPNRCD